MYFRQDLCRPEQSSKFKKLTTRLISAVETWKRCVPRAMLLILHLLRYYLLSLLLLSTCGGNKSNHFSRDFTRGAARYDTFIKSILAILLESTCVYPSLDHFFRLYQRWALLQFDMAFIARSENCLAETALTHGFTRGENLPKYTILPLLLMNRLR